MNLSFFQEVNKPDIATSVAYFRDWIDNILAGRAELCPAGPAVPAGPAGPAVPAVPAGRPPVEETSNFLSSVLATHGPNYLETLFGPKARNNLQDLGGVDKVAIALSESPTIEDFERELGLQSADVRMC